jgi:hypothetical protein
MSQPDPTAGVDDRFPLPTAWAGETMQLLGELRELARHTVFVGPDAWAVDEIKKRLPSLPAWARLYDKHLAPREGDWIRARARECRCPLEWNGLPRASAFRAVRDVLEDVIDGLTSLRDGDDQGCRAIYGCLHRAMGGAPVTALMEACDQEYVLAEAKPDESKEEFLDDGRPDEEGYHSIWSLKGLWLEVFGDAGGTDECAYKRLTAALDKSTVGQRKRRRRRDVHREEFLRWLDIIKTKARTPGVNPKDRSTWTEEFREAVEAELAKEKNIMAELREEKRRRAAGE